MESIGVNSDLQASENQSGDNVLSKLHGFGEKTERNGDGGVKSDLTSIGIIVFMLLVGMAPF